MTHTTTNLQRLLGRRALLTIEKLTVLVDVLDSRQCWDRVDCLVSPIAGDGQQWVSVDRLREDVSPAKTALTRVGGQP